MAEKGLGKGPGAGLGALFGNDSVFEDEKDIMHLPIEKVEPRMDQPRSMFDEQSLMELSESLQKYGLIQPITVRKLRSGFYQIIAGERRWRAARMAGMTEVPVRVLDADDRRAMELALVENLQREDLNPIEEARGYQTLMQDYGLTQEQAAQSVGKSRPTVTNAIRLLSLNPHVMEYVEDGLLSAGHARALLSIKDPSIQHMTADKIIAQGLSVRQTEAMVSKLTKNIEQSGEKTENQTDMMVHYVEDVEKKLTSSLGRKVKIQYKEKKGKIQLEYYDAEDLEALIQALGSLGKMQDAYAEDYYA